MEEWKEYKLGEIAEFRTGKLNSNAAVQDGKYPFFTCAPETYCINVYAFDQKAILLAGNNAEGNFSIKYYEGKFNAYQRTYVINPISDVVDIRFLYYALQLCLQQFKTLSQGTSTKFLTAKILNAFCIQVPSLIIQKRIAGILKSLDDKIEVNRRINDNLEQQAQALFKSWFVDFEPFKNGDFTETDFGLIPKEWRILAFKDFIEASTEKAPVDSLPEYSVTNNGIIPREAKFNKKLSKSSSMNKVLRKDNLVFGMSREILNWGIMEDEIGGVSSAYNIYKLNQQLISPTYLKLYMKARLSDFNSLIGTAAREGQSLDKGQLMQKQIYIPSEKVLQDFFDIYRPITKAKRHVSNETSSIASLRDTLLPRLMLGELKVNEIENVI